MPAEARSAKVGGLSAREALEVLIATNAMNRALFASLGFRGTHEFRVFAF